MRLSEKFAISNPREALGVLDTIAPLVTNTAELTARRQHLLESIVGKEAGDLEAVSQLAVIYKAQGGLDRCERLLAPNRGRLGTREGARILGQIFAKRGEHEQAVALLLPYTEGRLQSLHGAEEALAAAYTKVQKRVVDEIKDGVAPRSLYERARKADKAQRNAIFLEYFQAKARIDPEIKHRKLELLQKAVVVPVALELGIALLQRARGGGTPSHRLDLEKAEKVFLAIRGVAGESNEYRLALAKCTTGSARRTKDAHCSTGCSNRTIARSSCSCP